MNALSYIQIVMINTTLPANIGSAARAMHTMGLSNLIIVEPKLPIDESSFSHAAGGIEILKKARVVSSLNEAIGDSQLVFAASSRSRTMPRPLVNPRQSAHLIKEFLSLHSEFENTPKPLISILFGREDRGLTNEELASADYHIQIDANPNYPVLNVASAVQVISSFIYSYFCQTNGMDPFQDQKNELTHIIRQEWDTPPISHKEQEVLNTKLIELMERLELADKDDLRLLPQRLSRMTSRIQLDQKEYQLINAVLGKMRNKLLQ